ncbi:MAG: hypothetical protein H7125_06985 [Proteobacteria bacterium]|nr:hypothetical protein [Burkholderiales bacterium]
MACVIRFTTASFDIAAERPNPINPIAGVSLLLWLRSQVPAELEMSEPDAEDWGWYASVRWKGRAYLIGATAADEEEEGGRREWMLQIDKHRSVTEKLMGREKMTEHDECARYFMGLLEGEPTFSAVSIDPEP